MANDKVYLPETIQSNALPILGEVVVPAYSVVSSEKRIGNLTTSEEHKQKSIEKVGMPTDISNRFGEATRIPVPESLQKQLPEKIIASEVIGSFFDTSTRRILGNFRFGKLGAIQIGEYESGVSGDVKITPAGIVARNTSGATTFSLDGETGDATFAGTLTAGTIISGSLITGSILISGSGVIQIGTYVNGVSGDIRIIPSGILARDSVGVTTFSLDGATGAAIFRGTIAGGSININNNFTVDSSGNVIARSISLVDDYSRSVKNTLPTPIYGSDGLTSFNSTQKSQFFLDYETIVMINLNVTYWLDDNTQAIISLHDDPSQVSASRSSSVSRSQSRSPSHSPSSSRSPSPSPSAPNTQLDSFTLESNTSLGSCKFHTAHTIILHLAEGWHSIDCRAEVLSGATDYITIFEWSRNIITLGRP